jgi:hypothetical protein
MTCHVRRSRASSKALAEVMRLPKCCYKKVAYHANASQLIPDSMLKRFQMDGRSLKAHEAADRLLLAY